MLLYIIPLVSSFFFLLKKLYYKHLSALKQTNQQGEEISLGEILLYFSVVNLYPLCAYSYLHYNNSTESDYWSSVFIFGSILVTLFAIYNIFYRPEIIGSFRSSFKS
jgi:hypothetical protein